MKKPAPDTGQGLAEWRLFGVGILWRNEFQQVADFAVQDGAEPSQNIGVQACDGVVIVFVELGRLHLSPLAEFCPADAAFLQQFGKTHPNLSIAFQKQSPPLPIGFYKLSIVKLVLIYKS